MVRLDDNWCEQVMMAPKGSTPKNAALRPVVLKPTLGSFTNYVGKHHQTQNQILVEPTMHDSLTTAGEKITLQGGAV